MTIMRMITIKIMRRVEKKRWMDVMKEISVETIKKIVTRIKRVRIIIIERE